jgi:parallel beta-helix repeat protein
MTLRMRRGGGVEVTPPPPSQTYGPTLGRASVIAGVGARTVGSPGTGISFNSSSSLQSAINANPVGSTFVCSTNTPVWNSSVDTGTKAPTIIFPGIVGQRVINGGGSQVIPLNLGPGATLQGGTWQNFGNADFNHGLRLYGDGATVEDAVVSDIFSSGIAVAGGDNCTISHCTTHDNGMSGYSCSTTSLNLTIEYCDVYGNNTRGLNPGNQGGAGKISGTDTSGHFHHNYAHDNNGFGMWWDTLTNTSGCLIEENVCENNARTGLFYEANDAAVIRHNYVANNGSSATIGSQLAAITNCVQLRVSDSNCITGRGDVSFNLLDYTPAQTTELGMLLVLWDHTGTVARSCQNWDVHDNQFWLRGTLNQRVGGQDTATGALPVWNNNSFYSNQYRVASMTVSYWKWDTGTGGGVPQDYVSWQGFHGGDNVQRIQI